MFSLIDGFIAMVGQSLSGACHVTQVQAWSNKMGAEDGKLLADAIKAHANYEQIAQNMFNGEAKVNMTNKGLDAGDAWIMGAALEKNDTVTEVDASSNNLGVEGGKALADCLKSNTSITQVRFVYKCSRKQHKAHRSDYLCHHSCLQLCFCTLYTGERFFK